MCGKYRGYLGAFLDLWQWLDLRANFRKCGKQRSYGIVCREKGSRQERNREVGGTECQ